MAKSALANGNKPAGNKISRVKDKDKSPDQPLTEMQRQFVINIGEHGMNHTAAARAAGFNHPTVQGSQLMRQPKIRAAIATAREAYAKASGMTRQKVIDGFIESIDMARIKSDPLTMIAGWREVGKMCGFYEPSKSKIEISVNGKVMLEKLSSMSDAELLQLTQEHAGEFEVIDEESPT